MSLVQPILRTFENQVPFKGDGRDGSKYAPEGDGC